MKSKIAAALFALFAVNAAQADVINNGNFELGSTGWTISGDAALVGQYGGGFNWGGGTVAQDGKYAISFNGGDSAPNGQVAQTFATTAGKSYTLSFDYGTTSPSPQSLNWGIFGVSQSVAVASGLVTDSNPAGLLNTYTFDFVANSASSTLRFTDYSGNYTYSNDALLDNISVNAKAAAIPEPGSLALLGLGIFGLGVARRRKAA
jgi:hypothetical protein